VIKEDIIQTIQSGFTLKLQIQPLGLNGFAEFQTPVPLLGEQRVAKDDIGSVKPIAKVAQFFDNTSL
jgi:hypothetical protein